MCLQSQSLWMKNFSITANIVRRIYSGCCVSKLSKSGINFFFCKKKTPFLSVKIQLFTMSWRQQATIKRARKKANVEISIIEQVPLDSQGHDLWPAGKKIHWEASQKLSTCMLEELKLPLSPPSSPHCTSYSVSFQRSCRAWPLALWLKWNVLAGSWGGGTGGEQSPWGEAPRLSLLQHDRLQTAN